MDSANTRMLSKNIKEPSKKIIVTTIDAMMQKMISKENLYQYVMSLKVGDTIKLDDLKEKLVLLRI